MANLLQKSPFGLINRPSNDSLPISQEHHQPSLTTTHDHHDHNNNNNNNNTTHATAPAGLRRRISSHFQGNHSSDDHSRSFSWSFMRRSKSMSAIGEAAGSSIRKWWQFSLGWFSSKKRGLMFTDLEGNDEPMLGSSFGINKPNSIWSQVLSKLRSQLNKILTPPPTTTQPMHKFHQYDSFNYAKNFDDGTRAAQG